MRVTLVALFLLAATPVRSADFQVSGDTGCNIVRIFGRIDSRDDERLKETTVTLPSQGCALISLSSVGGDLAAGLSIATMIRLRQWRTIVPDNTVCASICGIIWLAGFKRFAAPTAHIGFHAAFAADTGEEKGVGNAVLGSFLTRIGLGYDAIAYITQASPNQITWLSAEDAARVGIIYQIWNSNSKAPEASPRSATVPQAPKKSRAPPQARGAAASAEMLAERRRYAVWGYPEVKRTPEGLRYCKPFNPQEGSWRCIAPPYVPDDVVPGM
jgi:ATP-dependent protease ClpP protease subunit